MDSVTGWDRIYSAGKAGWQIKVLEHKTSEMLFPEKKICAMFNVMAVPKR